MTDTNNETLRRVERAFKKLTPRQGEVLLMVRLDGLSYAQIAERLGITPERVERHFADALCNFDRHLNRPEKPWWRLW